MRKTTITLAVIAAAVFYILLEDLRTLEDDRTGKDRTIFGVEARTVSDITIYRNDKKYMRASGLREEC